MVTFWPPFSMRASSRGIDPSLARLAKIHGERELADCAPRLATQGKR